MNEFIIPATQDEILTSIGEHAALHTATGWRLAAELAAIVRLPGSGNSTSAIHLSALDVAAYGYRGLKSQHTVERYVKIWLERFGRHPEPGEVVGIPDDTFPPETKNVGSRTTKANIGEQIKDDPKLAKAAASALVDGAVAHLDQREAVALAVAADRRVAQASPRAVPVSTGQTLDDRWMQWLTKMNALFTTGARLADESEAPDVELGTYAAAGKALYETMTERRVDAAVRQMLEDAEVR
jgi:hypothetical protein